MRNGLRTKRIGDNERWKDQWREKERMESEGREKNRNGGKRSKRRGDGEMPIVFQKTKVEAWFVRLWRMI